MASAFDLNVEKKRIACVIDSSVSWAANKDTDLLFNCLAQDSCFFIFHPDSQSTIIGFDAFRQMTEDLFLHETFKATGYEIKELRINLSKAGDVAWYSAILDDFGEFQGKTYAWKDARWTGVLEKRGGNWVIVQMHFSFASDAKADDDN